MSESRPICEMIGHLGIETFVADDELIDTAVVIFTTVDEDGKVSLRIAWPEGQNWLTRYGMFHAAADVENWDTLNNGGIVNE